jgi:HlyD family secretion protein
MNTVKKKNNTLKYLVIGVVALIIIAVVGKQAGWIGKKEGLEVTVAKVERKTIIETVSANGRVQPEKEVKISSDVSGEIRELYVKEGDSVVAGKLMARIDPELYQSALDRSEASLNNTKAALATSKARMAQAEARFVEISKLSVEQGERVVGTSQMAGTEMMRIANLNDMEVSVDVNENDIIKVGLHDTAEIEVDAYPNRKFKGLVTEIANSATTSAQTTSDQVTNFVVKIRILRSSYADLTALFGKRKSVFRPGMSASVEIQTERTENVLSVPIEAVTVRPLSAMDTLETEGKKDEVKDKNKENSKDDIEVVFIKVDNKAKIRKVKTGIQDDKYIQILEGIRDEDLIISGPYSAISKILKHDDDIKEVSKDQLFDAKKKED